MTTNFRVRMRREHDSDEWFTGREHARILTHISSVRRVCEPMTLHYVGILQYSYSNNYEHPSRSRIWLEILISFLKFSLHILEHERVYILLDDYAFETFRCFGLKGFTFTSGLYLDLSNRSTGVSFLSSLYSRRSWGFASRYLGKHDEALRTTPWTTFCLVQFNEGRHCNYQPPKLYLIKINNLVSYTVLTNCKKCHLKLSWFFLCHWLKVSSWIITKRDDIVSFTNLERNKTS